MKTILKQERSECKLLDRVASDDTYAFFRTSRGHPLECQAYQKCKVVAAPFTVGRSMGGAGWVFQKRSPFLPILNHYYWKYEESGLIERIWNQPKYDPTHLLPDRECETLDGHAVSMLKVASLFAMLASAACLSITILWCVISKSLIFHGAKNYIIFV